jgi:hypothetical protein
MSEREDEIVYLCACDVWDERAEGGYHIPGCGQKILALNVSRLRRDQERHMPADMRAHNCDGEPKEADDE